MNERLKRKIENLPARCGVYKFYNKNDMLVYVGKSSNLRNRVRSYFSPGNKFDGFHSDMALSINDIDIVETYTELEALVLEDKLIKTEMPIFNVRQKNIKCFYQIDFERLKFPYLKIIEHTVSEGGLNFDNTLLPEISLSSHTIFMKKNTAQGFIDNINNLTGLRKCKKNEPADRCMNFGIGNCIGPCFDSEQFEKYQHIADCVRDYFNGNPKNLFIYLSLIIEDLSENFEFEQALEIRDGIESLKKYYERRKFIHRFMMGLTYIEERARKRSSFIFVKGDLHKVFRHQLSEIELESWRNSEVIDNYHSELPDFHRYERGAFIHSYLKRNKIWDRCKFLS